MVFMVCFQRTLSYYIIMDSSSICSGWLKKTWSVLVVLRPVSSNIVSPTKTIWGDSLSGGFFSHSPQILNFSPISLFQFISLEFRKFFFSAYFSTISPWFRKINVFLHTLRVFCFPPTFTMMHLCITQYTYWTPLLPGCIIPFSTRLQTHELYL